MDGYIHKEYEEFFGLVLHIVSLPCCSTLYSVMISRHPVVKDTVIFTEFMHFMHWKRCCCFCCQATKSKGCQERWGLRPVVISLIVTSLKLTNGTR